VKLRLTVRGSNIELRGYLSGEQADLNKIMSDLDEFGRQHDTLIIFSVANDDYDPFIGRTDPQAGMPGLSQFFPKGDR
jgi:hypothetical protein